MYMHKTVNSNTGAVVKKKVLRWQMNRAHSMTHTFPNLASDGGSVVHEVLASVNFLLLAASLTRFVIFGLFKTPDVLLIGEESLFTTLSESSAGALAELFLGGVRILLSSLCNGFSSATGFRLGV
jgi:hypothetical protein